MVPDDVNNQSEKLLLNLGCGDNYHADWTNLDLVPSSSDVVAVDLSKGIPFENETADAVYHSHVLEHLTRDAAVNFISDCFRVLKPGGVLRIAVPDLEQIAAQYLETVYRSWQDPSDHSLANHQWMQLELLDQILRRQSGGEMGKFMSNPQIPNEDFVTQRLGLEYSRANQSDDNPSQSQADSQPAPSKTKKPFAQRVKRKLLRWMFGKEFIKQLDEIEFRNSGEIHQWMYDRVSLRQLLSDAGFVDFRVCTAIESRIEDFSLYNLDARDGNTLKPDSIFVEAIKPKLANAAAA